MDVGGKVSMNITFFSPVDPKDERRESLPVSYLSVNVASADGQDHQVSLYTDVSAEWASGDRNQVAQWERGDAQGQSSFGTGSVKYHKFWRQNQQEFSEDSDQAAWGSWYYATENNDGVTYQSGAHTDVRGQFVNNGRLPNSDDNKYRAINDNFPVFGFARELGAVSRNVETIFTINLLQQNSVQFATGVGQVEAMPAYWRTQAPNELSAVATMYYDYRNAGRVADAVDMTVDEDSRRAGGDDYAAITTLAVRQAYASFQIAGSQDKHYLFMKEISSNGNFQTVDVIFPLHPILLYMSPEWMKLILDPLYINMEAPGMWPQDYAIHDLGDHYPNATGHADGVAALQPLEESGNMLIMTLAYAQKTGDNDYLNQHWDSLHKWGQWLISNNSVIPFNQISTGE
jgi:hypothetical protein